MVISFDGVTKLYKGKLGVEDISFDVGQASIAGLIGPNGIVK